MLVWHLQGLWRGPSLPPQGELPHPAGSGGSPRPWVPVASSALCVSCGVPGLTGCGPGSCSVPTAVGLAIAPDVRLLDSSFLVFSHSAGAPGLWDPSVPDWKPGLTLRPPFWGSCHLLGSPGGGSHEPSDRRFLPPLPDLTVRAQLLLRPFSLSAGSSHRPQAVPSWAGWKASLF